MKSCAIPSLKEFHRARIRAASWPALLLAALCLAAGMDRAFGQGCVLCALETKSVTTNRYKTGVFGPTVGGVGGTNIYRTVTTDGSDDIYYTVNGGSYAASTWTSHRVDNYPTTYTPDQLIQTLCGGVANGISVSGETKTYEASGNQSCSATRTNGGAWTPNDCPSVPDPSGSLTVEDCGTVSDNYESLCYTATGTGYSRHWELNTTYTDLYSTADLIAGVLGDVYNMPYPTDWSGGAASLDLASCDRSATASKMKYRFSFQSETNTLYRVAWEQITAFRDGRIERIPMEERVPGNGGVVHTREYEVLPKSQPFTTWVQGGADGGVFVEDPDSGGPPGSGGPGGGGSGGTPVGGGGAGGGGGGGGCRACRSGSQASTGSAGAYGPSQNPRFSLSLGASASGLSAGSLQMSTVAPSTGLGNPSILKFTGTESSVVDVVSNGYLRQIKAPKALANVVSNTPYKFQVEFYLTNQIGAPDGNGVYAINGGQSPFVTWTVENPDGSTASNRWQFTETRSGISRTNLYEHTGASNSWKLSYPGNLREDEFRTDLVAANGVTNQVETAIIRKPGGADVYKKVTTYRVFSWGVGRIEERVGPDSNPEITTYHYYASGINFGSYIPLQQVVHPNGSWERYEYDGLGRLITTVSQVGNTATNASPNVSRVTTLSYEPVGGSSGDNTNIEPNTVRTTTESLNGIEIGRRYKVITDHEFRDIVCPNPGAAWNDSANLVTTNVRPYYVSVYSPVQSTVAPDGTVTSYNYSQGASGSTNVVATPQTYTVTLRDPLGYLVSNAVYDYSTGSQGVVLARETYSNPDEYGRPQRVTYLDGTFADTQYACCGIDNTTDRDGVTTQFIYDGMKRQVAAIRLGITTSNVLDAADRVLQTVRQGSDNSVIIQTQSSYDTAGRLLKSTNALGGVTAYAEFVDGSGQTIKTNTAPDGGTRIETFFQDGTLAKVTGTAAFPMRYEYGVESDGGPYRAYTKGIKLDSSGSDTPEWTKTYTDGAGHSYKTVFAGTGSPYRQSSFNNKGQLWKERDPDGVIILYAYNAKGEHAYTAIDSNRNDTIDFSGQDRITQITNDVVSAHGTNVLRTRTYVWETHGSSTATLLSTVERSVEGFQSWQTNAGAVSSTARTLPSSTAYTLTQTAPDASYSITLYQSGRVASVTRYDSGATQIGKTTYSYDAHGRRNTSADARNGTTTYTFNNADQIVSVATPPPGTGAPAQTTTTYFDALGRATNVVQPDGTSVTSVFSPRGELVLTSGSRTYPVGYSYDAQGHMKTMTNWSTFSSGVGARVTTWHYDAERGWLTNKVYDDGKGTKYSYTAGGRLSTRLWARGTNTTYTYNNYGDLSGVSYNDGATPTVGYTYTRRGQQEKITRGSDAWKLFYTTAGKLLSEAGTAGTLNGLRVTNAFDAFLRRTNVATFNSGTQLTTNGYTYDLAGRLSTARDGTFSATYSYLANSPLVSQIDFKSNTTVRLTTTKTYDKLNRLSAISSLPSASGAAPLAYNYSYNDANQRTRVNLADGSFWIYEYDSLGQVKSGKRYWSDWTPVAGQQFEYGFDDIANRTSTKTGGDAAGANLRTASYTNNSLNQITGRDVPAYLNIIGAATATATNVNVNNTMAYRRGEYYRVELNPNNSSTSVWQSVTNRAVQNGTTNSVTGNVFLPKHAEAFSYDADGNLTNDGRWAYVWDGENRLVRMFAPTTAPSGSVKALTFGYDWQGRRISKTVSNYSGSAWSKVLDEKYVCDSWNRLASLNASNNAVVLALLWGTDLSGSMQGAGGVGGLLVVKGANVAFAAYDGNGNVTALINAAGGDAMATYEYGVFGEVIRLSGTAAKTNPFRFSTKIQDDETDLLYYGYRELNASIGRWPNRDPIGEPGFELIANRFENKAKAQEVVHFQKGLAELMASNPALAMRIQSQLAKLDNNSNTKADPSAGNLFVFVKNDPASNVDVLGLDLWYHYCLMSCPTRCQVGYASALTLWPVSDTILKRCCKATEKIFCKVVMHPGGGNWTATLTAAEVYFQACVIATH